MGLLDDANAEAAKRKVQAQNDHKIQEKAQSDRELVLASFYSDVQEFVQEALRLGDRPLKVRQRLNGRPVGPTNRGWSIRALNASKVDEQVLILENGSVLWADILGRPGKPIFDDPRWDSIIQRYEPAANKIASAVRAAMVDYLAEHVEGRDG